MEYSMMILFCLFIVVILIVRAFIDKNIDKTKKNTLLITFSLEMFLMIVEAIANLISVGVINAPIWVNYFFQTCYFILLPCLAYSAFLLNALCDNSRMFTNKKIRYIAGIPALIMILIALINPATSWLFYVASDNTYHRGDLNFIQFIVTFFYMLTAFGTAIYKLINKKYFANRIVYVNTLFFTIIPVIGSIFQIVLSNIGRNYPFSLASIMLATIILYLSIMAGQVQLDFLTNLYNKNKLFNYLHIKMKPDEDNLYLILLDINKFKSINDNFGHIEGDNALRIFSSCLKDFCSKNSYFAARYGGDEFIIVVDDKNAVIDEVISNLSKEINEMNDSLDKEYKLYASIGYAKYSNKIKTIPEFIAIADEMMYKNKKGLVD